MRGADGRSAVIKASPCWNWRNAGLLQRLQRLHQPGRTFSRHFRFHLIFNSLHRRSRGGFNDASCASNVTADGYFCPLLLRCFSCLFVYPAVEINCSTFESVFYRAPVTGRRGGGGLIWDFVRHKQQGFRPRIRAKTKRLEVACAVQTGCVRGAMRKGAAVLQPRVFT